MRRGTKANASLPAYNGVGGWSSKPLSLIEQQELYFDLQPRFGQHGLLDSHYSRIGDQLAGNGEFMVGQGVDELFTGSNRFNPCKS